MSHREIRVCLLGCGVVGSQFRVLLEQEADHIARVTGCKPVISGVITSGNQADFSQIIANSDILVELVGNAPPIFNLLCHALKAGMPVVTANKDLLAKKGEELYRLAKANGTEIYCEAAAAGVVPIIRTLQESLEVIRINRIQGIVNGTTNFILGKMAEGMAYTDALGLAQKAGYAEADPTADVTGLDAAAKLVILTRLAFGAHIDLRQVDTEGITEINKEDVSWCRQFYGYVLKLVGTAKRVEEGLSVSVYPVFLSATHPLAAIHGAINAVSIQTALFPGPITLQGPGAGGIETATAVLGDLISAIRQLPGSMPEAIHRYDIVKDSTWAFYLHLDVLDELGVLEQLMHILSSHGLSIHKMDQVGNGGNLAKIGIVTHPALESRFFKALAELESSSLALNPPRYMRVLDA